MMVKYYQLSSYYSTFSDEWHRRALMHMDNVTKILFDAFDTQFVSAGHLRQAAAPSSTDNHTLVTYPVDDTWTMITAVFFTTTLLTTIGYGRLLYFSIKLLLR